MTNQLGTVYCSVDIALGSNNVLFNREKLYDLFTGEITKYLNKYGINYQVEPLSGLGGGGGEGLLAIFRELWQQHWIIGFIISSIKFLFRHYSIIVSYKLFYRNDHSQPRVNIFLRIKSDEKIDKRYLKLTKEDLKNRLLNLNTISENLFQELSKNHPLFYFDREIRASLYSIGFRVKYNVPHERNNKLNFYRLKRHIKSLNLVENRNYSYYIPNASFIIRTQQKQEYNETSKSFQSDGKLKKYYFIISSKTLFDYFNR